MSYNINKKQRKARRTKKVHKSVPWTPLIKLDMNMEKYQLMVSINNETLS